MYVTQFFPFSEWVLKEGNMKVVRHGPSLDKIFASVTENEDRGVSSADLS